MNPIFAWVIAETTARTTLDVLTRRCPKCGRRQVVPGEKLRLEVKCERCGAKVPPEPELKK